MNLNKIHYYLHILSHEGPNVFEKLLRNRFLFHIFKFLALWHGMFSIENSHMGLFYYAKFVTLLINIINIVFDKGNICGDHRKIVILRRCSDQI